jgi:alpha-beta hydrolase superfamily lysophospholipase
MLPCRQKSYPCLLPARLCATNPGCRLLALAAITLLLNACGGAPRQVWHKADLDEEFRASQREDVQNFSDYLALEDRLFGQLQDEVYAEVDTGPEFGLVRYSSGSAADPQGLSPNWNRSFLLPVSNPVGGVLLLHGMSDSPYSLRRLGETLQQLGYVVIGLRLPGHGTAPSGLLRLRWQDMAASVELAVARLGREIGAAPLHMVGYSNGAPLALNFTLDALEGKAAPVPASLVLISPAIGLATGAGLASWKRSLSRVPGLGGMAWLSIQPEFDPYKYNSFATNAGAQVYGLTKRVARRIAARARSGKQPVLPPTLVFKSTVDATTSTQAVLNNLLGRLAAGSHELVLFDINRFSATTSLLVDDPGPLTRQVMADESQPFAVTLITNRGPETLKVTARKKLPFSAAATLVTDLETDWPRDVLSLSHVALPFAPADPLYGRGPPREDQLLFLGQQAIQGERGLLRIPADWLLRLRHNPFYSYLEDRTAAWMRLAGDTCCQDSPATSQN